MEQKTSKDYSKKILRLSRELMEGKCNEKDVELVTKALSEYAQGNYEQLEETLEKLGDDYKLLENLINKLKGKSVYTGLKNLIEGKDQSNEQAIISTASLISHCAIEIKTDKRYRALLPDLYRKLGVLINE